MQTYVGQIVIGAPGAGSDHYVVTFMDHVLNTAVAVGIEGDDTIRDINTRDLRPVEYRTYDRDRAARVETLIYSVTAELGTSHGREVIDGRRYEVSEIYHGSGETPDTFTHVTAKFYYDASLGGKFIEARFIPPVAFRI